MENDAHLEGLEDNSEDQSLSSNEDEESKRKVSNNDQHEPQAAEGDGNGDITINKEEMSDYNEIHDNSRKRKVAKVAQTEAQYLDEIFGKSNEKAKSKKKKTTMVH